MVGKEKGVSLYYQIETYIKDQLASNAWPRGTKIPSEPELMAQFNVSRDTLRHAIGNLVNEGLLERRHGSGTYVQGYILEGDLSQIHFSGELEGQHKIISINTVPADHYTASCLALDPRHPVWEIVRLRYIQSEQEPSILSKAYLSTSRFPEITRFDLSKKVYDIIEREYSIPLLRARTLVQAVMLTEQEAKWLHVSSKMPVLMLSKTCYSDNDSPVVLSKSFYPGSKSKMIIES